MLNDLKLAFRRLSKSELLRCCMIEEHRSQVLGPCINGKREQNLKFAGVVQAWLGKEDAFTGTCPVLNESHLGGRTRYRHDTTPVQTIRVLGGLALNRATRNKEPARGVGYRHARRTGRCEIALVGRGRRWAIKTNPRTARGH
jgi:hypothetical protein